MSSKPSFSIEFKIPYTKCGETAGSPPVMFIRLIRILFAFNSYMILTNFGMLKAEDALGVLALLQKGQDALQPLVTFTYKFIAGAIGRPGVSRQLHPIFLINMSFPNIFINDIFNVGRTLSFVLENNLSFICAIYWQ